MKIIDYLKDNDSRSTLFLPFDLINFHCLRNTLLIEEILEPIKLPSPSVYIVFHKLKVIADISVIIIYRR